MLLAHLSHVAFGCKNDGLQAFIIERNLPDRNEQTIAEKRKETAGKKTEKATVSQSHSRPIRGTVKKCNTV